MFVLFGGITFLHQQRKSRFTSGSFIYLFPTDVCLQSVSRSKHVSNYHGCFSSGYLGQLSCLCHNTGLPPFFKKRQAVLMLLLSFLLLIVTFTHEISSSVALTEIKDRLIGHSACFPSARAHSRPPGLQNRRWRWGFKKTCLSSTCFGRSEQGTGFGETAGAHMTIPRIVFSHLDLGQPGSCCFESPDRSFNQ